MHAYIHKYINTDTYIGLYATCICTLCVWNSIQTFIKAEMSEMNPILCGCPWPLLKCWWHWVRPSYRPRANRHDSEPNEILILIISPTGVVKNRCALLALLRKCYNYRLLSCGGSTVTIWPANSQHARTLQCVAINTRLRILHFVHTISITECRSVFQIYIFIESDSREQQNK
jgi:hypothetical protein